LSELHEETIASQRLYDGRIVNLRVDQVRMPSGRVAQREVVEHRGAVAIVAIDAEGRVLLVRQFRTPIARTLLEIPAGTLEPGEDPLVSAQREMQEETGFAAGRLELLVAFYSAPGFCTEYLHVYRGTDLYPSRLDADDDENIVVERVTLGDALAMVRRGDICDAKSIVGLLLAGT
jgi:ADP-ribose pyrophosphatase